MLPKRTFVQAKQKFHLSQREPLFKRNKSSIQAKESLCSSEIKAPFKQKRTLAILNAKISRTAYILLIEKT
ncbi:hypothetical protein JCM6292_1531 [Bacteroides pyogenes JCM 6292]|uniref:Uncharacterized protein n=2 Tax=Bacteroides pyogenes TaxID=310300 RepID=W4PJT7_9BACE|nr:hypothetical protein JCM6292_1531 [Bacteroides pyogenes JCM 6292]GAE20076.1 hypothetical protein JCM6294_3219 [Bacteroides pyogenes DSM 20611 = JCM 6294]